MKEQGYHGTCKKHQYSIEHDGLDPAKCNYRNDHWLGQGVYFFDDFQKARWWASTISSHNGNCGGLVYRSLIEANDKEVLNLDDTNQLDEFFTKTMRTYETIQKECQGKMPVFDEKSCRAVFFDYYKQKNGISVTIRSFLKDFAGYTTERTKEELNRQKKLIKKLKIPFLERQICVSKKECIKLTRLVYNEKDEVI